MLSGAGCDSWGCPVHSQELDPMILVGPFQDRIFYDSMTLSGTQTENSDLPVLGCAGKATRSPWQCWALALYLWFFSLDYLSKMRDSQEEGDQKHELKPNHKFC